MDEIKELKEELARLRERVAVLEARTSNTILIGQRLDTTPINLQPPYVIT